MSRVQRVVSVLAFAMIVAAHASASAQLRRANLSFDDDGVASRVHLSRRYPGIPSQVWTLFGNRRTDPIFDFLGTTDAAPLAVRTDNLERLRILGNTRDPQLNPEGEGTGRAELYTNLWVLSDRRPDPTIPVDYSFLVTPDIGHLSVSNDAQVSVYSPVDGLPLLVEGDIGSLSVANTGQVLIDTPVPGDSLRVIGESGDFLVSGNGQVTIQSSQEGNGAVPFHHALVVNAADQGIAVNLDRSTPESDNNFVTFFGRSGDAVGRIEGQTWDELLFSPEMIMQSLNTAMQAFALGVNISEDIISDAGFDGSDAISLASLLTYEGFNIGMAFANVGVSFQSGGADYAEYLARADENEEISYGDIVGVFGGRITKRTAGAQRVLAVSAAPAVVGNMPEEAREQLSEKVALLGQVRVKVIGPVEEGDYIIPSGLEDGTGLAVSPDMMTASEFTRIVGRAWESSPNAALKHVMVAVGINSGDIATLVEKHQDELAALRVEMNETTEAAREAAAQLAALRADIASLRQAIAQAAQPEALHRQTVASAVEGDPGAG